MPWPDDLEESLAELVGAWFAGCVLLTIWVRRLDRPSSSLNRLDRPAMSVPAVVAFAESEAAAPPDVVTGSLLVVEIVRVAWISISVDCVCDASSDCCAPVSGAAGTTAALAGAG